MVRVVPYSRDMLVELFMEFCDSGDRGGRGRETPPLDNPRVRTKHHIGYLHGFLEKLDCRVIVVEDHYIDRDYLEDFAAYHVRSFYPYRRHCARLHFFGIDFDAAALSQLIASTTSTISHEDLQAHYYGFVVVKPLPFTVVGRTCLRTYDDDPPDRRLYPVAYREKVNLYGLDLDVTTLPFQEQDRDVAACASSALWSVFHATGKRFQHAIPSPVQITNIATQHSGYDERVLPNQNGLNSRQIADAIRAQQLEPSLIGLKPQNGASRVQNDPANRAVLLRIAAAAYLRAGIPCILLATTHEHLSDTRTELGHHAMALTGYRMSTAEAVPYGEPGVLLAASRINRLYAHDDQVGPFARMNFENGMLQTAQVNRHQKRSAIFAEPLHLMVPLYHKIRIPFQQILKLTIEIDKLIETIRSVGGLPVGISERLVWDIELVALDEYRTTIRASTLPATDKLAILTAELPRFIWRLGAENSTGEPLFDMLFDPTDLLQGRLFLRAIGYHPPSLEYVMRAIVAVEPEMFRDLPLEAMRAEFARLIEATGSTR